MLTAKKLDLGIEAEPDLVNVRAPTRAFPCLPCLESAPVSHSLPSAAQIMPLNACAFLIFLICPYSQGPTNPHATERRFGKDEDPKVVLFR